MGTNFRQNSDGSISVIDDYYGEVSRLGGANYRANPTVKLPLTAAAGNGGVFAWSPGVAVVIMNVVVDITTNGGANTISIGTAANGTTSSNNLIDTLSVAATGAFDNITDKGASGKSRQKLTAGQYVTGTASALPTGLVGYVYISYINV